MVKINLLLKDFEACVELDLDNSSDLNNFITNELGLEDYILYLEDGSKKNSKNILLIDDFLKNKINPSNDESLRINILLENKNISKNNIYLKNLNLSVAEDLGNFIKLMNNNKIISEYIEKIYERTLIIMENYNRIKSQRRIYDFYLSLYTNKINKLKNNLIKKTEFFNEMKNFNNSIKESVNKKYFKDFKKLRFGNINILEFIEKAKLYKIELFEIKYDEFYKSLETYEKKLECIKSDFINIEKYIDCKITECVLSTLSDDLEDFIKTQFEYFLKEFKKIIQENANLNNPNDKYLNDNLGGKNILCDLLASFENFWKNLNENNFYSELLEIESIKECNSQKLKILKENNFKNKFRELIFNFNEIHLLKKHIRVNYDYLSIPSILTKQLPLLENEIHRRKKFEFIFEHMLALLKEVFIEKEEEYLKKFNEEMNLSSNNNLCKFFFKALSEDYNFENFSVDETLFTSLKETSNSINKIINLILSKTDNNYTEKDTKKDIINFNNTDIHYLVKLEKSNKEEQYNNNGYNCYNINQVSQNSNNQKLLYEDINEVSFNGNMNKNIKNTKQNIHLTPLTPILHNLNISNNNCNNINLNQTIIFEEYENLLNNFNEKIIIIQKELNGLLTNYFKYTEKELFQIDSNQKCSMKNSTNTLLNINNSTLINLNLEFKNSENLFDDSVFINNKESKRRYLDETNIIQKNNISCNNILANYPNSNIVFIIENIFTNIQKIKSYLKLVNLSLNKKNNDCENKEDDFDLSMNSLINSIYISKVVQNQTTKYKEYEINENRNITEDIKSLINKNQNSDLASFLKLHVHKFYFYEDIYNLLQNFIEKKKIKYELDKDNSNTLGKFIENIINKYIKIKNESNNLKNILRRIKNEK